MHNKRLTFLSCLLVGVFLAAAAVPVLAWSWATPWSMPTLTTATATTPTTTPKPVTPPPTGTTGGSTGTTGGSTTGTTGGSTTGTTTPGTTAGATALEQQMLDLLNQDRAQNGQKPLALNPALSNLARQKAQDMVTNNYFDHYSPTLGWPPQMVQKAGIAYRYGVGENIVEALTVTRANMQLMASPTHKANLLDPGFTDVGIGIVPDHYGGVMAVQEFIGR